MQQQIDEDIVVERLIATLSGFFGALALLLAGIGLYGLIAYTVSRRTREIGIRMAGGAAIGVPAALMLSRLVRTFLYGVSAQDPLTVAGGVTILLLVAAAAALIPARHATHVEPTTALRYE